MRPAESGLRTGIGDASQVTAVEQYLIFIEARSSRRIVEGQECVKCLFVVLNQLIRTILPTASKSYRRV